MPKPRTYRNLTLEETLRLRLSWLPYLDYACCVRRVLEHMGFEDLRLSERVFFRGRTPEGGCDMSGWLATELGRVQVLVQVKRSDIPVQRRNVDELRATMLRLDVPLGFIVTTGTVSNAALRAAAAFPGRPVRHIDGAELARLMVAARLGVAEERDIATGATRLVFNEAPFERLWAYTDEVRELRFSSGKGPR